MKKQPEPHSTSTAVRTTQRHRYESCQERNFRTLPLLGAGIRHTLPGTILPTVFSDLEFQSPLVSIQTISKCFVVCWDRRFL